MKLFDGDSGGNIAGRAHRATLLRDKQGRRLSGDRLALRELGGAQLADGY